MEDNNEIESRIYDRTNDPYFVDKAWLDTIVVIGLTCFVLCLMKLSKVATSKMGMLFGMVGMAALVAGYWADEAYTYDDGRWLIAVSMAPGILLGLTSALSVEITSLPELVGAYNGFGGLAAAIEATALYVDPNAKNFLRGGQFIDEKTNAMLWVQAIALVLSIVIGMMTFTGSMIACFKLHGTIASKPRVIPYRSIITVLLFAAMAVFGTLSFTAGQDWNDRVLGLTFIIIVAVLASVYGIIAVMAIGGGDMPVSISFLNALSGMSTSAAGFMISNEALVVSGAFISCSGVILTLVMCKNMNRSISKVLVGGFGDGGDGGGTVKAKSEKVVGTVKEATAWDVFELLINARKVIIVPGYGMAVAKAQHACAELASKLRARDVNVLFGIHPVAGRMPGHMNVLLAEAKVPYDITFALEDINADFADTDVALVLGANDIVNPAAQTDADSPIAGMPVLEVWKSTHTICMKRSLNVGYAGVDNPLFVNDNNAMFLGDAKTSLLKLISLLDEPSAHLSTPASSLFMGSAESVRDDIEAPKPKQKTHQRVKSVDPFLAQISELQRNAFLKVGVVKEIADEFEARVAVTPDIAKRLLKSGIQVLLETNAGLGGGFVDGAYAEVGCKILNSAEEVYNSAGVIVKIREPTLHPVGLKHEIEMMTAGSTLVAPVSPQTENGRVLMNKAREAGVNLLAVDAIPRISRAQNLDTLSSQSKIAGYRAVIEAAYIYQRFMNGEVTSAGSFGACKVLVIGCGVAGLAAISTASNMGSIVRAFDTRLECREQVESLGGEFLVPEFDEEEEGDMEGTGYSRVMSEEYYMKEMELFSEQAKECQIIITTAAIPGRAAPKLLMKEAVDNMKPGSVIVDLAASTGGNCQLTRPGSIWTYDQRVTIIAYDNLSSRMSWQASSMYANNMANLLDLLCKEHKFVIDMEDPVVRGMTVVFDSNITWPPPKSVTLTKAATSQPSVQKKEAKTEDLIIVQTTKAPSVFSRRLFDLATVGELCAIFCFACFFVVVALFAPISFVNQLLYFILAGFLGFYLIWAVEPALFSPLMSTSNSLSGVVVLGGILMASEPSGSPTNVLACSAIAVSTINVVGGFAISYRMLLMFKKEE